MKKGLIASLVTRTGSRRNFARTAPKFSSLRTEPLESRELLSATDVVFAASALAQDAVVAQNYSEQGAIDLSDVELSASNAVSSTTWTVTSPVDDASVAGTLRNALENADDGDTIVFDSALQGATIAIGSRLEVSKSITIDASNLLDATTSAPGLTISGQGTTSILYLNGNYDVEIDGIAFTNGNAASTNSSDGGAITSIGATLSLNSCAISDSVSVKDGGGAYLEGGKATFTDCVITNNTASKTYGGGVYANGGEATFVNCSLTNNTANFGGSAIASNYATLSFDGCSISDNAGYTGGGLNISFGSATLTDCVLTNNTVQYYGGAVYNHTAAVSLDNCLISDNKAQYYGGAAYANYGKTKLVNCTVTNNTATRGGGGVYLNLNSEADSFSSYNSIIAGNAASSGAADVDGGASFAPYAKAYNTLSSYSNWADGANNVAYDSSKPLFKNAATKDYSLAIGSQAIDKGDNQRITEGTEFDLAGNPRIDGAFVDLGAYEFQKIKLDAPENPNETDRAETTITVAWDAVQDASGYQLAWKKATDSDYTFVGNIGATTTSYTIANLDTGVIYEWKVQAVGDGISYIDSDYTAPRSVKTLRKLDAPGSLSETAKTETTITVSWGSVANASGYQLAWKDATASDYTLVDNIAAATTSYTIDGLDNAATYEWKVQAIGDDVDFLDSDYSETRTSKPRQGLTAPGSLSETAKTETTITVAWDSVANASGYRVAWKNATDSDYTFVDNIAATTYTIDGLDNAATYEWKVQAIGDGIDYADSDYSQTRTVKPRQVLDAPTISLGAVEATTIAVSWTAVDAASSYRVTLQPVGGVSVDYDVDASATSYTIAVAPTTTYAVKVAAVGDGFDYSDSEYSNSVTAVTPEERLTVVTTENDVVDEFDGVVSLREALVYAESGATITFDSSLQGKTIKLALGELAPSKSITIDASSLLDATASASGLTISGQGTSRILSVGGDVSVAVSGITFANGYTDGDGGAVLASSGSTSLVNCVLTSNTGVNGGAVYAGSQAVFTAAGCLVVGNAATNGGGLELNGSAELSNCTIVGNSADNGGGVDLAGAAVLNVYNTIILDNVASIDGDDVYFAGSEAVANARNTLSNFKDWTSGERNPNYNESKPLFTDAESGDYSLAYNTQVLDKGNNNYVSTDVDVAGNPRISDKTVDIGAYEYQKIVLATPTPSITSKTTSSIKVVWDAVPDAVGYRFIWKNRLDSAFSVYTVDASTTEYEFTELNEGIYYLKIQALADKIGYADSEYTALQIYQTQITLSAPTLSAPYPTAQTNAKAKTETSITAAWKAVPHATGYVFQWKNETDSDFNVVQLGASTTSYKFSDLDNAATYEWKVQALGDAVDYLDSPDTELQIDQPRQKLETPIPYAKTKTETSITIAWDANPNATGYRFIWKNRTDAAFKVFTVDAETTEYEFPNLDSDGIYYWKVQALGDQIDYANSEYTALEIDKPQKSLAAPVATAASASTAYATVKWTYVPNAVGYGVSYKPVSASEWSAEINAGTNLRYVIEGFESGVEYNVRVRALGDEIDFASSDYSESVVFQKLDTPIPSAVWNTETSVTVSWNAVSDATGYRLIWKNRTESSYTVVTLESGETSLDLTEVASEGIHWKVQALGDNVSILNSEYCALQVDKPLQTSSAILDLGDELFDELDEEDYDRLAVNFAG